MNLLMITRLYAFFVGVGAAISLFTEKKGLDKYTFPLIYLLFQVMHKNEVLFLV